MIIRHRILLALAACTVAAFSQEASKDDLWDLLKKSSGPATKDNRSQFDPRNPASPYGQRGQLDPSLQREIFRKSPLGSKKAGRETWPEANLKYEFGDGWVKADVEAFKEVTRTYYWPAKELNVVVTCSRLTQGETTDLAEVLKQETITPQVNLKQIEATGRAAELGMAVFEGNATRESIAGYAMTVGRMAGKGAVYGICVVAGNKAASRREFDRFLTTLDWIEKDKDIANAPITGLSVAGAGFSIPCEGALLAATLPEQPYGSAAQRLDQRLEITAFDVRGCEMPLREMAICYLKIMAASTGGNHVLLEKSVGGLAGLTASPKQSSLILGREMDWQVDFTLRDGFFCTAMGSWIKGRGEYKKRHEELIGKIRFTKPEGPPRALANAEEKNFASLFYNEVGLTGFQRGQYNASTRAFEIAVEMNPQDPNMAQNLVNSLTKQGKIKSALSAVEKARTALPDHQELKQWQAALLIRSGSETQGSALYEELFKGGLRDQQELGLWIEALQKTGRNDRASEIAKIIYDETGQLTSRQLLANCLWTAGKTAEARAHYGEMAAELGNEQGFASDHAALLLEIGDFKAVMDLIANWENENEAPSGMLFSKGMAQSGLGWYKDAVATFTILDGKMPGNQTVKEALANAQAMMGRGSHEGIRDDLAAVTIPEALQKRADKTLAESDLKKDFAGEGSVTLANIRVWDWSEGNEARMTQLQRTKILDASGVKAFSTLYVSFKPHSERLNINRMVVTDKNGKELATYKRDEMHVRDGTGELADGEKIICIPVPTLEEGAVIDFVYTKSLLGTGKSFPMAMGGISEFSGLVYGAVAFTGEIGKIRFSGTDRLKVVRDDSFHAFEAGNIKRRIGTSHLPPFDRWGLMYWACDKRTTWETETSDYLAEIRECLADESFAAKVVSDLNLAGESPTEVTRKVVRWLNEKFQYQGLEFGRRARIPAKGEITLSRGFGDCKDLSLMVRAVLRQAGVKANLALVNSSGTVREDMPNFDQFDHMVVHLPEMGSTILDATIQHFNTPEALSLSALGGKAFVIEGDKPGFVTMHEAMGAERLMTIDRNVTIDVKSGDAHVTEGVLLSPAYASAIRYALSATAGAEHLKTMESMMSRKEPRIELREFKVHDLDDPFKDLKMDLGYVLPGSFQREGESLSGTLPGIMEGWMFGMDQERDRSIDMMIRAAERCVISNHIRIPDGYKWIAPPELKREAAEPGSFEGTVEWQPEPENVRMDATLKFIPSTGKAELYQRVRTASDTTFRHLGERLRFGKE